MRKNRYPPTTVDVTDLPRIDGIPKLPAIEDIAGLSVNDEIAALMAAPGGFYRLFALCEQCEAVFSRSPLVKDLTGETEDYKWHTTFDSLKSSVTDGCHFCALVVSGLRQKQNLAVMESSLGAVSLTIGGVSGWKPKLKASFSQQGFRDGNLLDIKASFEAAVETQAQPAITVLLSVMNTSSVYDHWTPIDPALSRGNTNSAEHVALARLWIDHCQRIHHKKRSSCNWHTNFVPTRLLRLSGSGESLKVNLHITSDPDRALDYCCLSYCWGGSKTLLLTKSNSAELKKDIPIADIPKTYLDAIHITQSLGVSYLWIDSLCIFQDSEEDWTEEAAAMARIYTNSYCTIAAAGADDCHEGCYATRNPLEFAPCRIAGTDKDDSLYAHWRHSPAGKNALSASPLFREGIAFNCRCIFASETDMDSQAYPLQSTGRYHHALWDDPRSSLEWVRHQDWGYLDTAELHDIWFEIVTQYSTLQMTKPEDKLVALSGVAQVIASAGPHRYLGGLWQESLIPDMLWYVHSEHQPRPAAFRAPSWYWASVEGRIHNDEGVIANSFGFSGSKPMARFIGAEFSPTEEIHQGLAVSQDATSR